MGKAVKVSRRAEPVESEHSTKAGDMLDGEMRPPSPGFLPVSPSQSFSAPRQG